MTETWPPRDIGMNSVVARKIGRPDEKVIGAHTNMAASRGETRCITCDRGQQAFDDWFASVQMTAPVTPEMLEQLLLRAWTAAQQRHVATLRRVGWLDQKGRVWTETPSGLGFDGGSLTPLLIDVRED